VLFHGYTQFVCKLFELLVDLLGLHGRHFYKS
jgi:hypothetical protein